MGGFETSLEWAEEEENKRKEGEEEGEREGEGLLDGRVVGGGNVLMMGGKGGGEGVCEWVYERRGGMLGEVLEMGGREIGEVSFLHFCAVEGKVFYFILFYFSFILFFWIF